MTHTRNHESQSATNDIHLPQYPLNGTQLECDGSELRSDGTCAKCERINERIASHYATPPTDIAERSRRTVETFNKERLKDLRPRLSAADSEMLADIIAAEFGGQD